MRRSEYHPEWFETPHLLSFVTDETGGHLAVHADLAGRKQLLKNDRPHTHLFTPSCGGAELTESKLADQPSEVNVA